MPKISVEIDFENWKFGKKWKLEVCCIFRPTMLIVSPISRQRCRCLFNISSNIAIQYCHSILRFNGLCLQEKEAFPRSIVPALCTRICSFSRDLVQRCRKATIALFSRGRTPPSGCLIRKPKAQCTEEFCARSKSGQDGIVRGVVLSQSGRAHCVSSSMRDQDPSCPTSFLSGKAVCRICSCPRLLTARCVFCSKALCGKQKGKQCMADAEMTCKQASSRSIDRWGTHPWEG